jgi:drug/metabolite transporter (DMT)-like permease
MLGIGLMLVAALCNATASVLQRQASRTEPSSAEFSLGLIRDLAHQPGWLLGVGTMLAGFLLHAVAISVAAIALVQPVLVVELPFTIVLAALTFRLRVGRREWLAIGLCALGLGAVLGFLAPSGGAPQSASGLQWGMALGGALLGAALLVVAGYRGRAEHRAAYLGVATGAVFGVNSSLIAGIGASVSHGGNLFLTWQTFGVVVIGPLSFYLLQNALSAGNLVATQPGFTLTNPLVSVLIGVTIFGEQTRRGGFLVGAGIGALLIGCGVVLLSRSELLDPSSSQRSPT